MSPKKHELGITEVFCEDFVWEESMIRDSVEKILSVALLDFIRVQNDTSLP